jgi:hypothetical protein
MATNEQLEACLRYQLGAERARTVAPRMQANPWHEQRLTGLVIMRSDLDGFRAWIAELKEKGASSQPALEFLRRSIALIRRGALANGRLFERQHGDRTTAIFPGDALFPGDEPPSSDPWTRAVATGIVVLRERAVLVREWSEELGSRPPALRLGITGFTGDAGEGRVVNAVIAPTTQPPEIFSLVFEKSTDGYLRCLHSIADGLCEIASNEADWMGIHKMLNDSMAVEAAALWQGIVRGRRDGMLLVDLTHATADFLPRLESDLWQRHPDLSEFSFIQPSVWAWDPRNGERRVAMVVI